MDVARRLIAVSDVVTENFRPGTLQKYGLDYQSLVRFHRDLVMVSASLWGQKGAYARYAAFAPVFGALAGLSAVAGLPNGIPTEMRMPMDYTGGLFIAYATLQGVLHRDRTGQGQHVDLSGRDTVAWMIGDVMMEAAVNGRDRPLVGNQDEAWAPHGAYACREPDTWISIAVTSDEEWQGLCREMKRDDLGQDPGYSDVYQRWQHREELDQQIAIWTRQHEPGYLTEVLQQAGVPAFPSFNARDIFQDPHLQERELFNTLSDGKGKSATVIAPPWRIDGERPQPTRKAPTLGQDMPWALGDLLEWTGTRYDSWKTRES